MCWGMVIVWDIETSEKTQDFHERQVLQLGNEQDLPGSSIAPGCGLDVADRRCVTNTPGSPAHIQFALPAQLALQSTTIGNARRTAEMPCGFGGGFIAEPDTCSLGFRLRIIRSAVRLLQSTRSRAGSVDGLVMCGVRLPLCAARQGPCRLVPARVSGEGRWASSIAPAQARRRLVAAARRAGHGPAPRDTGEHPPHITHRPGTRPGASGV